MLFTFIAAIAGIVLDQWSKLYALNHLKDAPALPVLGKWLQFQYLENRGAAFGILQGKMLFFLVLTLVVVAALVYASWRYRRMHPVFLIALGMVMAGAIGNLADRIRLGFVVDFIQVDIVDFYAFPIFNVADLCVTVGVVLLIWFILRTPEKEWENQDERTHRK